MSEAAQKPRVSCPDCGRRVKAAGLADHQRDSHRELSLEELLSEKTGVGGPMGGAPMYEDDYHDAE